MHNNSKYAYLEMKVFNLKYSIKYNLEKVIN